VASHCEKGNETFGSIKEDGELLISSERLCYTDFVFTKFATITTSRSLVEMSSIIPRLSFLSTGKIAS
jgi:hypothetical protein